MTADPITITFKTSEEFSRWLKKEAFDLDMSASEVIRACIKIGLPAIKANPLLVSILAHGQRHEQEHFSNTERGKP